MQVPSGTVSERPGFEVIECDRLNCISMYGGGESGQTPPVVANEVHI